MDIQSIIDYHQNLFKLRCSALYLLYRFKNIVCFLPILLKVCNTVRVSTKYSDINKKILKIKKYNRNLRLKLQVK